MPAKQVLFTPGFFLHMGILVPLPKADYGHVAPIQRIETMNAVRNTVSTYSAQSLGVVPSSPEKHAQVPGDANAQ